MTQNAFVIDGTPRLGDWPSRCNHCLSYDGPFIRFTHYTPESYDFLSCIPCLGRAIQDATGWKVLNTFSQWRLQQITGAKTQAYKQAVREARMRGMPEPERPDDLWKPGQRG